MRHVLRLRPSCLYAPLGSRKFSFAPLNTHDQCLVTSCQKNPNLWGLMMNFWLEEKVLSPTTCMTDHLLKLCRQERWWILHKEKKFPSSFLLLLSISSLLPFYPGEFQVVPDRMLHVCCQYFFRMSNGLEILYKRFPRVSTLEVAVSNVSSRPLI